MIGFMCGGSSEMPQRESLSPLGLKGHGRKEYLPELPGESVQIQTESQCWERVSEML